MGRIEIVYEALDEMAQAILHNRIPMVVPELDPNTNQPCSWPDTYLAWKDKVIEAEKGFNRKPLTKLQWQSIELYLANQYGLAL